MAFGSLPPLLASRTPASTAHHRTCAPQIDCAGTACFGNSISVLSIKNITLFNGTANTGGCLRANDGQARVFLRCSRQWRRACLRGGGAGTLQTIYLDNVTLTRCVSTKNGGALAVSGGSAAIRSSTITGCKAGSGTTSAYSQMMSNSDQLAEADAINLLTGNTQVRLWPTY